jgi:hypothetical protein
VSDIDTAMVVDSLKVLDPKPPIREADIGQRLMLQQRSRFQPLSKCSFDRLRCSVLGPLGVDMNRREFITLVGGAAAGLVSTQPLMQC